MNTFSTFGSLSLYNKKSTAYSGFVAVPTANPTTSGNTSLIGLLNSNYGGDATVYLDRIYVAGYSGSSIDVSVYSISGGLIQKAFIPSTGNSTFVTVWNGYVYVANDNSAIKQYYFGNKALASSNLFGVSGTYTMVFDASNVYFPISSQGKLVRMPSQGGTYNSTTHDIIPSGLSNPTGVAVYEEYVYVVCRGSGNIVRYNKNTGTTNLTFITGLTSPTHIKVYGEYIFVVQQHGSGYVALYKQNGNPVSKTFAGIINICIGMDVNDNRVYVGVATPNSVQLFKLTHNAYEFRRLTTVTNPYYVYSDGNYVWFTDNVNNSITRIQVSNTTYTNTLSVGTNPVFIIQANSLYWVANNGSNNISVITPATNGTISVTSTISVPNKPRWLASDTTSAWVAYSDVSNNLYQINLANTATISSYTLDNSVYGIISDGTYIWATVPASNSVAVYQISSLSTSNVANTSITVGANPTAIAYNSVYVYVTNTGANTVSRITRYGTPTVFTITVGITPISVYSSDTYLWVLYDSNKVVQINVSDNTIASNITLNGITNSYSLYSDGMYTWVTNSADTLGSVPSISQIVL